jgi:acetylornithine/succinyldiaminopimelate/putrescine aminotransferase
LTRARQLGSGDLLPHIEVPPPGPGSRSAGRSLLRHEAPGINTMSAGQPAPMWLEARGANVLDVDGNRYIDMTSGFGAASLGHRHPRIVEAVERQSRRLLHGLGDVCSHPARASLARSLSALAPMAGAQVYFAVSGAEAVEIALKTALLNTDRPAILAFEGAYHGLTLGALAVTSRPEFRLPFSPYLHAQVFRLPFGCPPSQIDRALTQRSHGCVIVEPILGREGVIVPPPGWLSQLAELCRLHGALLVVDEILTGFGRTGQLFAVHHEGVVPDLLCCGKTLGGGLPIAAVIATREHMAAWPSDGEALHTATFVAHPLSCAAARAALRVLEDERLVERVQRLAPSIAARLRGWEASLEIVREVRGQGFLWGVEMSSPVNARRLVNKALWRGVVVLAGGSHGQTVQLLPTFSIAEPQLAAALGALEESLREIADSP